MSKNKRFELIPMANKNDLWYGLFDNSEKEYVTDKLWGGSEKVCDKLNELADENKQIKHTIQEAYETERTALGKSVLKQILDNVEAIK